MEREAEIRQWVGENRPKVQIAKLLNCNPKTVNSYLIKLGIEYAGNQSGKGISKPSPHRMPLEEYLANSKDIQSNKVRKKLLEDGYKNHQCERCGNTEWLGQPIPLELHHKDGNKNNNTLENYELLCPNCHAFTESYRGKNIKK